MQEAASLRCLKCFLLGYDSQLAPQTQTGVRAAQGWVERGQLLSAQSQGGKQQISRQSSIYQLRLLWSWAWGEGQLACGEALHTPLSTARPAAQHLSVQTPEYLLKDILLSLFHSVYSGHWMR